MASANGDKPLDEELHVEDDENYTDKKFKQRILNQRARLSERREQLWSEPVLNENLNPSMRDALVSWGNLVKGYISDLAVLLTDEELRNARFYAYECEIYEVEFVPQPAEGYDFRQAASEKVADERLIQSWAGFKRGADLPDARTESIDGLLNLLEYPAELTERWHVIKNPRAAGANHDSVTTSHTKMIPRYAYDRALQHADAFLKGIKIGPDITAGAYTGDDNEPGL